MNKLGSIDAMGTFLRFYFLNDRMVNCLIAIGNFYKDPLDVICGEPLKMTAASLR